MPVHRSTLIRPLVGVAVFAASCLYAIAQQPPTPSRVRGTIEAVDGDVLSVKSRGGEDVKLRMTADVRVVGIVNSVHSLYGRLRSGRPIHCFSAARRLVLRSSAPAQSISRE